MDFQIIISARVCAGGECAGRAGNERAPAKADDLAGTFRFRHLRKYELWFTSIAEDENVRSLPHEYRSSGVLR